MGRHGIRAAWESVPLAIREQIADIAGQRIVEAQASAAKVIAL